MFSWSQNAWSKYTQSSNLSDEECFLPTTATKTWQSELFSAALSAEWRHSAGSLAITPFGFQRLLWSGHSTFITETQSVIFSCRHTDSSSNLSDKWENLFSTTDSFISKIGHFRVPLCLSFKASLSAKPFLWKWLICTKIKLHAEKLCT